MLRKADEKCEAQIEHYYQQREAEARQEIVDLEARSHAVDKEVLTTELLFGQCKAKL